MQVDPTDWRHMCLCGSKGSIIVLRLLNLGRDKVEQQSYKVDMSSSKPGDTLRCCFSTTRDLLYVLLPREVSLLACQLACLPALPSAQGLVRLLHFCSPSPGHESMPHQNQNY